MNLQSLIHWLEQGRGAAVGKLALVVLGVVALSATIGFKQFHGPRTEETLRQADLGRSLASGEGFTSSVNYPKTRAVLAARGQPFRAEERAPELYHPPGYAVAIAGALAVLPRELRARWFATAPVQPDGFAPDYLMLGLNIALLWIAIAQTWRLAAALFDERTGRLAGLALLLSSPVWTHTVAVDGTPLAMVLWLGLFQCLVRAERAVDAGRSGLLAWAAAGAVVGLLFLTDYPSGFLVFAAGGHALWRRRPVAAGLALATALLVATPWLVRNARISGHVLGLGAQDIALRAGDSTAEPQVWRATLSAELPRPTIAKLGNKTLSALQDTLRGDLWSGGGLVLTAFFVTGWIYRFRRDGTNRLRTLFALALALIILAHGLCNSGEGERLPTVVVAPLIVIFGAGFFQVLVVSSEALRQWPRLAGAALLLVQALPLWHDLAEPRRIHFSYPPYHPAFFLALGNEVARVGEPVAGWMADVPAGAAWYSGRRVWAQPATLHDFYAVDVDQHQLALVLTPATLDRPFFAELIGGRLSESRFGEWGRIYTGLISGDLPRQFPLRQPRRLADNFQLLLDPALMNRRGK